MKGVTKGFIGLIVLFVLLLSISGCGPRVAPTCGNNICEMGEETSCPGDCESEDTTTETESVKADDTEIVTSEAVEGSMQEAINDLSADLSDLDELDIDINIDELDDLEEDLNLEI